MVEVVGARLCGQASRAFEQAWNYDFRWSTAIGGDAFGDLHTRMGHASYAVGDADIDPSKVNEFQQGPNRLKRFLRIKSVRSFSDQPNLPPKGTVARILIQVSFDVILSLPELSML